MRDGWKETESSGAPRQLRLFVETRGTGDGIVFLNKLLSGQQVTTMPCEQSSPRSPPLCTLSAHIKVSSYQMKETKKKGSGRGGGGSGSTQKEEDEECLSYVSNKFLGHKKWKLEEGDGGVHVILINIKL